MEKVVLEMKDRFFEISSPGDMLGKAKRDFDEMKSHLDIDTIFNFFVTAYHVMNYVEVQGKASEVARSKFYEDEDFKICQYICNKGKHLHLKKGDPYRTRHNKAAVFGEVCFGEVTFAQSESYSLIADGRVVDVIALAQRVLDKWEGFFRDNNI